MLKCIFRMVIYYMSIIPIVEDRKQKREDLTKNMYIFIAFYMMVILMKSIFGYQTKRYLL